MTQTLKPKKTYKLRIAVGRELLNYTGTIIWLEGSFFSFIDKFNQSFTYNINTLVSYEEVTQ